MQIEAAIYQRLGTFTPLTDLIGPKLYPTVPTENTQLPFVVYTISSSEPQLTTTAPSNLTRYALELDIWGINLDDVLAITEQTKAALHGYRGGMFQGIFLTTRNLAIEEDGFHETQSFTVWADIGATFAEVEALAQHGIYAPRLTLITDWTTHFETFSEPDQLGVFKYVDYRNKPHRRNPYTPHKGKRWELVFELPPTSTSWTFPTNYADSIRPHDNGPYIMNPTRNLRNSINPKSFRIGAKYGNHWLLSSETIRFLPNPNNPTTTKLGFGTPR
jgi:hypothetical protein